MVEPTRRTEREILSLATHLYKLELSWVPEDVRRIVVHFDWQIELEDEGGVQLDTGLGLGSGQIDILFGRMTRIKVEIGSIIDKASEVERRWLQDLFTESFVWTRVAWGNPAGKYPGEIPEIVWRTHRSTLMLARYSMTVSLELMSNEYFDLMYEHAREDGKLDDC